MKVKVKKGDYQPIIPSIIVTVMFFSFGGGFVIFFLNYFLKNPTLDEFMSIFSEMGMGLLIGFAFFILSLYLIYYFIKFPRKYYGKVVKCDSEEYKGKKIFNYTFKLRKDSKCPFGELKCYTYNEYDFNKESNYTLLVKEFNWKIKKVIVDLDNRSEEVVDPDDERSTVSGLVYVTYIFFFVFGGGLLYLIANMFYSSGNNGTFLENLIGIIFMLLFLVPAFYIYKGCIIESKSLNEKIKIDTKRALRMLKRAKYTMKDEEYNGGIDLSLEDIDEFNVLQNKYDDIDQIEVLDINQRGLYRIISTKWKNKYFIKNRNDCVEGKLKLIKNFEHYEALIKPMDKNAYYIGNRSEQRYNYLILGLDYKIKKVSKNVCELYERDCLIANLEFYRVNKKLRLNVKILGEGISKENLIFSCIAVYMINNEE